MVTSQNGWPANRRDFVSARNVPGSKVRLTVRTGPAGDLLLEVAALFDLLVRDIDGTADDWGYAERPIRGSTQVSNHASGTAIDLNATCWALGQPASVYLDDGQIAKVREIVAATGGVVRWGGDYRDRKDPMHFEINNGRSEADCARALAAVRTRYGRTTSAAPAAPTRDEVDMATLDELRDLIREEVRDAVWKAQVPDLYGEGRPPMEAWAALAWATAHAANARDAANGARASVQNVSDQVAGLAAKLTTAVIDYGRLARELLNGLRPG